MSTVIAKHRNVNRSVLAPLQRFQGFNDTWNEVKFSDVFSFKPTNSLSRDALTYDTGQIKNIHYGDIHTKYRSRFYINREHVPYIKSDINLSRVSDESYCQVGDIVIADASEDYQDIGKSIEIIDIDNQKVLAGLHTFIARPKSNTFALGFLGYLMRSQTMRLQIMILAQGTKVLGISTKYLDEILFKIPPLPEQDKIASFLSSVDEWIENLRLQKESLEKYRKGMMQKIFSQEIRFKDNNGKDFQDWEMRKLGEVTNNFDNLRKPISSEKRNSGKYPYYGANGIVDYVDGFIFDGDYILLAEDGVVDVTKYPVHLAKGKFWANNHAHILQGRDIDNYFLFYSLQNTKFARYITGSAQTKLNGQVLNKIVIQIPPKGEQRKIAEFLSSVDSLFITKQNQIAQAEEWKKGLMQKMFI